MKKQGKTKNWRYALVHPCHRECLFVLFNLIILISTVIITIIDIIYGTNGGQTNFLVQGWNYFMPFTINSNILMAIAAAIALVKILRFNRRARSLDPAASPFGRKFTTYYFMATVSLNLTATTVILFLAPLRFIEGENGLSMVAGDMFFFHLLNPALAVYSLLYLFDGHALNKTAKLCCFIPPSLYSVVYSTHVLILRDWDDFYNYTFGGNYLLATISATINLIAIYTIASLIAKAYNCRLSNVAPPKITLPRMK